MAKVELIVLFKALPGKVQELKAQLTGMLNPTHVEAGCEFYRAFESETQGHLFLHERWTTQAHLDDHLNSPHFLAFAKAIQPLTDGPMVIDKVTEFA